MWRGRGRFVAAGIRGSFYEPSWLKILDTGRFGISSQVTQSRFLQELTGQALEELDQMYGVRS